jgi:hypothetical protein
VTPLAQLAPLGLVVPVFLFAACSAPVLGCGPVAPAGLPDGSGPGAPRLTTEDGTPVAAWGQGPNRVRQRIFDRTSTSEPPCASGEVPGPGGCWPTVDLAVRGNPATLIRVGDAPETEWIVAWATDRCRYEVTIGPMTEDEAKAYVPGY